MHSMYFNLSIGGTISIDDFNVMREKARECDLFGDNDYPWETNDYTEDDCGAYFIAEGRSTIPENDRHLYDLMIELGLTFQIKFDPTEDCHGFGHNYDPKTYGKKLRSFSTIDHVPHVSTDEMLAVTTTLLNIIQKKKNPMGVLRKRRHYNHKYWITNRMVQNPSFFVGEMSRNFTKYFPVDISIPPLIIKE